MRRGFAGRVLGAAVLAVGLSAGVGIAAGGASPGEAVRCRSAVGAAALNPKLGPTAQPAVLHLNAFRISGCRRASSRAATATGTLSSPGASCPLAPQDRLAGPLQIDWQNGATTYIAAASLASTNNPADPFEARLVGRVTGGDRTGATLRAVLHLTPTHGDCTRGVGAVALEHVGALTIGGPYAQCDTVDASATIAPGLHTAAAPQSLHLDSFHVSGCRASDTATAADLIGALGNASVSCPLGHGEHLYGVVEVDWANHFVSILKRAHLSSTHDPDDPFQWTLHGVITSGADVGATLAVVLHAEPATGQDCGSGVSSVTISNVGPFTVT